MSVPVNKRKRSDAQYAMTAKLLVVKIYEICDNNPKRRDIRLNNPMALEAAKVFKHAMNAYSTYVNTAEDYAYRRRQLKKSIKHLDMVETYLEIWWMLQEKKIVAMPEGNAREEFVRKCNNFYDDIGNRIVAYRDEVDDRLQKDARAWRRKTEQAS